MKKRLIARISEGLGNQLFMYANAFTLSKKINFNLYLDNESSYKNYKNIRTYLLSNFNISGNIIDDDLKFNSYKKNIIRKFSIKLDKFRKKKNS